MWQLLLVLAMGYWNAFSKWLSPPDLIELPTLDIRPYIELSIYFICFFLLATPKSDRGASLVANLPASTSVPLNSPAEYKATGLNMLSVDAVVCAANRFLAVSNPNSFKFRAILLPDWLPTKTRETGLLCCVTCTWRKNKWIHTFPNGIFRKLNSMNLNLAYQFQLLHCAICMSFKGQCSNKNKKLMATFWLDFAREVAVDILATLQASMNESLKWRVLTI